MNAWVRIVSLRLHPQIPTGSHCLHAMHTDMEAATTRRSYYIQHNVHQWTTQRAQVDNTTCPSGQPNMHNTTCTKQVGQHNMLDNTTYTSQVEQHNEHNTNETTQRAQHKWDNTVCTGGKHNVHNTNGQHNMHNTSGQHVHHKWTTQHSQHKWTTQNCTTQVGQHNIYITSWTTQHAQHKWTTQSA